MSVNENLATTANYLLYGSMASYTVAFPNPVNYGYYCMTHLHSGMFGVVRVIP